MELFSSAINHPVRAVNSQDKTVSYFSDHAQRNTVSQVINTRCHGYILLAVFFELLHVYIKLTWGEKQRYYF